jgi:hypothetical protein
MKYENYEICQYLIISYMEALVKNVVSFTHFVTHDVLLTVNFRTPSYESTVNICTYLIF